MQSLYPLSVVQSNSWEARGGTDIAELLRGAPSSPFPDDRGYAWCAVFSSELELLLDPGTDPQTGDGFEIRIRARRQSGAGDITLAFELREGASVVDSSTEDFGSADFVDVAFTVDPVTAATVVDFEDLRLVATLSAGAGEASIAIESFYLVMPSTLSMTRLGVEVIASAPKRLQVTRVGIEVIAVIPKVLLFTRVGVEVIARRADNLAPPLVPLDLPDQPQRIFLHNWKTAVELSTAWQVDVTVAEDDGAEERRCLGDRPYRSLRIAFLGLGRDEALQLWLSVQRLSVERTQMPLYCDHATINAPSPDSEGLYFVASADYRRFSIGQRIAIVSMEDGKPSDISYATVYYAVGGVIATFTSASVGHYGPGSRIYPLLDVEIQLQSSGLFLSGDVYQVRVEVKEAPGQSALPALSYGTPVGYQLAPDSRPILEPRLDWSNDMHIGISRRGNTFSVGRAEVVSPNSQPAQPTLDLPMRFLSRADAWPVLRFLDSMRGRTESFYLVLPAPVLRPSAVVSLTVIRVASHDNEPDDIESFTPTIAIKGTNGTLYIRRIIAASSGSGYLELELDIALPGGTVVGDLVSVRPAYLMRQSVDEVIERWETDETVDVVTSLIGLGSEADVEIAGL